jgi:phosphoribosylformylglycinamidine cyclo-ligase
LFRYLRERSQLSPLELYRSLNMGHRLEIGCEPGAARALCAIAEEFGVAAKVVGRIEAGPPGNKLVLTAEGETLEYAL